MRFRPFGDVDAWLKLLRVDRPVGYWLLLWPTLWGLFAASAGQPQFRHFVIFVLGVLIMRSAGCVINDFADRDFDPHVARTRARPVAAGRIAPGAALLGFALLLLLALLLVLQTSLLVVSLAVVGALLAAIYPFMKRVTHFPQAWLGMAFGWGAVMAWAAERGTVFDSIVPWLLFAANVCWSLSYDTAYALADRDDDMKIGVKSTAIWLGKHAVPAVIGAAMLCQLLLGMAAWRLHSIWVWLGWGAGLLLQLRFCWDLYRRGAEGGFPFFLRAHWVGFAFACGLLLQGLFVANA